MTHWEGLGEGDRDVTSSIHEEIAVDAGDRGESKIRCDDRTEWLSLDLASVWLWNGVGARLDELSNIVRVDADGCTSVLGLGVVESRNARVGRLLCDVLR